MHNEIKVLKMLIFSISLGIYCVSNFIGNLTIAGKTSHYRPFSKYNFTVQQHFESTKFAFFKSYFNFRKFRLYFSLHPGSFGEIVSTFTIFDSDFHGVKPYLSLKRPLEFNAFSVANECEWEFLATFVVQFHQCIKLIVIYGFQEWLAGHSDNEVIKLQAGL